MDAQRAILDATEAILVEEGYDRFSIRRLQERCGYTAPTIYHHFGDKRGLLDELLEERCQILLEELRNTEQGADPIRNVRELARAFVRFGMEYPTHYAILHAIRPEGEPPPPSAEASREIMEKSLRILSEQGRLVADMDSSGQSLWATLHGVITLQTVRPDYEWVPGLADVAIDTMLRGLVRGAPEGDRRAQES
jgi:AcrR family transcriptional regulator